MKVGINTFTDRSANPALVGQSDDWLDDPDQMLRVRTLSVPGYGLFKATGRNA